MCVVTRNDMLSFFLYWSDDGQRVGWGQEAEVSMGQFRSLAAHLIREANRLCKDLMFGLEPDIDLLKIKDNMANRDKGYSFVTKEGTELGLSRSIQVNLYSSEWVSLARELLKLVRG